MGVTSRERPTPQFVRPFSKQQNVPTPFSWIVTLHDYALLQREPHILEPGQGCVDPFPGYWKIPGLGILCGGFDGTATALLLQFYSPRFGENIW